jgi:hypothetical protein
VRVIATLLAVLATTGVVSPAFAQMVEGPPASVGGLFGGHRPVNPARASQSLEMNLDVSGGYDQDPNAAPLNPVTGAPVSTGGWSVGQAMLASNYRFGSLRRSIATRGRGNVNYQGNTRTPLMGGGASATGAMRFGPRSLNQWLTSVDASYEPGWVFGAVNPTLPTEGAAPALDLVPEIGVIELRWFTLSATSGYVHQWNVRHQSNVQVGAGRVQPAGDSEGDNEWQNATFTQSWSINSDFDLLGTYRFDRSRQMDRTTPAIGSEFEPVQYQSGNIGVRYGRRLSPVKRLSLTLAGGATRVNPTTQSLIQGDLLHPTYSASFEFVPASDWSFLLSGSRSVTVLAGISSTPMATSNVAVSLNGGLARRLRLALSGSYMASNEIAGNAPSDTTAIGGNVSVRYGVNRWFATFATYSYYHHRLASGLPIAIGLPPLYDRHSVRGGITLWLPLYGTF